MSLSARLRNEARDLLDPNKHAGLVAVLTTIRCHALRLAGDLGAALAKHAAAVPKRCARAGPSATGRR